MIDVIEYSREEAVRLQNSYIGPEHLMLGIIRDGEGEAIRLLRELHANSVDAAQEKHVPAFKEEGNLVKVVVGSVPHPMEDDHYIEWIYLLTDKGAQIKYLHPHDAPAAEFALSEDEVAIAVYAYCNKHGLWKADIE